MSPLSGTSGLVEVIDCATIFSNVALLSSAYNQLSVTIQQLQDLHDKLLLFTSI
jgi:hypothetical protein